MNKNAFCYTLKCPIYKNNNYKWVGPSKGLIKFENKYCCCFGRRICFYISEDGKIKPTFLNPIGGTSFDRNILQVLSALVKFEIKQNE